MAATLRFSCPSAQAPAFPYRPREWGVFLHGCEQGLGIKPCQTEELWLEGSPGWGGCPGGCVSLERSLKPAPSCAVLSPSGTLSWILGHERLSTLAIELGPRNSCCGAWGGGSRCHSGPSTSGTLGCLGWAAEPLPAPPSPPEEQAAGCVQFRVLEVPSGSRARLVEGGSCSNPVPPGRVGLARSLLSGGLWQVGSGSSSASARDGSVPLCAEI